MKCIMSTRLTIAMLDDDTIIVANAVGGDGIIAFPKCSGCKIMVSVRALASRDNAFKIDLVRVSVFAFAATEYPHRRRHGSANRLALFRRQIGVIPLRDARCLVKN